MKYPAHLALPHVIARRLLGLVLLAPGRWLVFAGAVIGWGMEDAKRAWRDLP